MTTTSLHPVSSRAARNVCGKHDNVGLEERGHELGVEVRGNRGAGRGERWWKVGNGHDRRLVLCV